MARSAVYASMATATGKIGPRGQGSNRSVMTASSTDVLAMKAVSTRRACGSRAAEASTIVGHHIRPSEAKRSEGPTAARTPRMEPMSRKITPASAITARNDEDWRAPRTSDQRRRSCSRRFALLRDPLSMTSPRIFFGASMPSQSSAVGARSMAETSPSWRVVPEVGLPVLPSPTANAGCLKKRGGGRVIARSGGEGGSIPTISISSGVRAATRASICARPAAPGGMPTTTSRLVADRSWARRASVSIGPSDSPSTLPCSSAAAIAGSGLWPRTPA